MTVRADGYAPANRYGWRSWCLALLCTTLTACGGGGGSSGSGTSNVPPTASFTATPSSGASPLVVAFNATASSDSDGSLTAYSWNFGDGSTGTGSTVSHTYSTAGSYTAILTVTDNRGATAQASRAISVSGTPATTVTVSGKVTYDRVPFSNPNVSDSNAGLNYGATQRAPARAVVVEVIDVSNQSVLASTATDDSGDYSVDAPASRSVIVRAKAESRRAAPGWEIKVLNNTNSYAMYVLDSAAFNTGTAAVTKNLNAASGWSGSNYTGTRSAGPFALLDTLYSAVKFVRANGSASVDLPKLEAFWSTQNQTSDAFEPPTGQIQSTLYQSTGQDTWRPGIYVLGLAGNDTDEYDQHVLAHEFQHFLEDAVSRTETPGGPHALGDKIDLRLAFSEGFADAFSAMVLNDTIYKDSFGTAQASRFDFNLERNSYGSAGWYEEQSIMSIIWDLYDTANDAPDAVSLGYGPIYDAFTAIRTTSALVSFYPFIEALKAQAGAPRTDINALVTAQSILSVDQWGTGETNNGGVSQALPIYTQLAFGGSAQRVCGTTQAGTINAIGNRLFLRFSVPSAQSATVRVVYTPAGSASGGPSPDPDFVLYKNGFLEIAEGDAVGEETLTRALESGQYVLEVYEYSHVDPSSTASRRGVTCMDVTAGP